MRDFYGEIDKALKPYEENKAWYEKSIHWITNRIDWCWKWKKITSEQKDELCDRVIWVMEKNNDQS